MSGTMIIFKATSKVLLNFLPATVFVVVGLAVLVVSERGGGRMRHKDIVIGEFYRHKQSFDYGYLQPLEILKPKTRENSNNYIVVKCKHVTSKDSTCGLIRHVRPRDITRI